ncbi:MAG: hypothetical protein KGL39_25605, partial [Patescibacteria group bacterium]|nr:hypothetical protein [Patescibacteria group bacterium]
VRDAFAGHSGCLLIEAGHSRTRPLHAPRRRASTAQDSCRRPLKLIVAGHSAIVLSSFIAAKATLALSPGEWLRCVLLLMSAPDLAGEFIAQGSSLPTYRRVQFRRATSAAYIMLLISSPK